MPVLPAHPLLFKSFFNFTAQRYNKNSCAALPGSFRAHLAAARLPAAPRWYGQPERCQALGWQAGTATHTKSKHFEDFPLGRENNTSDLHCYQLTSPCFTEFPPYPAHSMWGCFCISLWAFLPQLLHFGGFPTVFGADGCRGCSGAAPAARESRIPQSARKFQKVPVGQWAGLVARLRRWAPNHH